LSTLVSSFLVKTQMQIGLQDHSDDVYILRRTRCEM